MRVNYNSQASGRDLGRKSQGATGKTHMTLWLLGVVIILWCGLGAFTFWNLYGATTLRANQSASPLEPSPKVSIIVAARNEEDALPAALESMLALDYPDYEIVLVDDDSRDRTRTIADEWAGKPAARGRLIRAGVAPPSACSTSAWRWSSARPRPGWV